MHELRRRFAIEGDDDDVLEEFERRHFFRGAVEPLELFPTVSASATTGDSVRLAVEPAVVAVAADGRFTVELVVDATTPVSHLPATIAFDATRLVIERVRPGGFLGSGNAAEVLADLSTPGEIVLGASRLGDRPGVAGHGVVAYLDFRALAPGAATIGFAAQRVMDRQLLEIGSVATAGARVDIRRAAGPHDGPLHPEESPATP
jgi:hypothetical protein